MIWSGLRHETIWITGYGTGYDVSEARHQANGWYALSARNVQNKDSFISYVTSENKTQYPDDGEYEGYWYVKQ